MTDDPQERPPKLSGGVLGNSVQRPLTRHEAVRWLDDHLGRFVQVSVFVELPDEFSTCILRISGELRRTPLNYRTRYEGGKPPAELEDMVRHLEEKDAVYSLGHEKLDLTDIEHLDVWIEEGLIDGRTHNPVDLLAVRLAPGVKLEVKYVAEND